jgi:hypothetical protein
MQRSLIDELGNEVNQFKGYKNKYERFVEEIAKSDEET